MIALIEDEVVALGEGRAVLRDGVLGPLADDVRAAIVALRGEGVLAPAGVGRDQVRDRSVRGDLTAWVDDRMDRAPWDALWTRFEALRAEANAAAWLGLRGFTVQIALYPGDGAAYARHRDAFAGGPSRRLTAIVYLNPGWRAEHGGVLQIWEPAGPRRVEPLHDRLVLFRSDALEHEVLPVAADRYAVTAWYGPH